MRSRACANTSVIAATDPSTRPSLRWHAGSENYGDPNPEPLGTIMPGAGITAARDFPHDTNMAVSGAVLRFRDAAGITWIRRPDGGLTEQS